MTDPDSPRRRELLEAAYRYVLRNGLADMSLRPLLEPSSHIDLVQETLLAMAPAAT